MFETINHVCTKSWQRLCRLAKLSKRNCIFYNLLTANVTAGRDARRLGKM